MRRRQETVEERVQRAVLSYKFGACTAETVAITARSLNHRSFAQKLAHASALMTLALDDVSNLPLIRREQAMIEQRMMDDLLRRRASQRRRREGV